jgi:hypothetical protein
MNAARQVTASFELGPNVQRETLQTYGRIQDAYKEAAGGELLKARGITFFENLSLNDPKSITIRGGYDSSFTTRSGNSMVKGTLTISKGTIVVDGMAVR